MSPITFLSLCSLALAALHVAWSFVLAAITRGETRVLEDGRERVRLARVKQIEVDQRITTASGQLEDLSVQLHQVRRRMEQEAEAKLRFQILIGRPAQGFSQYAGTILPPPNISRGKDAVVWLNPVGALIWAAGPERARYILMEFYPRALGYTATLDSPSPVLGPIDLGEQGAAV